MPGLRRFVPIAAAVAATVAVTLAGAGIAAASGAGSAPAKASHAAPAAPACHLWAVVNQDGTLARAGCRGTTSRNISSNGTYSVLFPVNVRSCAYEATIGLSGSSGESSAGFITVVGRSGHRNGVFVATSDISGNGTDRGFHLLVTC